MGSDRPGRSCDSFSGNFNPRSPCGERLPSGSWNGWGWKNFNPRSPCGERRGGIDTNLHACDFNPRSPCGERHQALQCMDMMDFISIHAPRVGSDQLRHHGSKRNSHISIHAPRVGSDAEPTQKPRHYHDFNPRSPCGERPNPSWIKQENGLFQSTLPVWGATALENTRTIRMVISIHAPRVGSDEDALHASAFASLISIHAPRVGSDPLLLQHPVWVLRFQSTLPVWGATVSLSVVAVVFDISIHAPRVGSDRQNTHHNGR